MAVVGWPRTLNWGDFRVVKTAPDGSIYHGNTGTYVGFTSQFVRQKDKSITPAGIIIKVELVKADTWVVEGKQTPSLLSHEQGHFDIAGLIAHELDMSLKQVSGTSGDEAKSNMSDMFKFLMEKRKTLQSEYDNDTKHSQDTAQQVAWKRKIKDHINNQYEPL